MQTRFRGTVVDGSGEVGVRPVHSVRKWSLIACPVCKSRSLSFREARKTLIHYRPRPDARASDTRAPDMLGGGSGPLYEHDSRTSYVSDIQVRCDDCGFRWVLEGTRRIEDLDTAMAPKPGLGKTEGTMLTSGVLEAMRSGLSDSQVISKLSLSSRQLEMLLQQLVEKGLFSEEELDQRLDLTDTAITRAFDETRKSIQELSSTAGPQPDVTAGALERPGSAGTGSAESGAKTVNVDAFIAYVKQGLSDSYLMKKFSLNRKQLEFMFQRLVDSGRVTVAELYERTSVYGSSITKAFVEVYESLRELDE